MGNVLVTVSDRKIGFDGDQDEQADYYEAEVLSASDYYPFGWSMPGRQFAGSEKYRFGFNGKENDSEWGSQVIQDYGFRIYNPSIGKFLSVDPLSPDYPELTPYQFASNTPIQAIDLDGLEKIVVHLLDKSATSKISLSDQAKLKKEIDYIYECMNVDLTVEFVTSGKVKNRDEFYKRDDAHWSDTYIVVGNTETLKGIDFKETGWKKPEDSFGDEVVGTSNRSDLLSAIDVIEMEEVRKTWNVTRTDANDLIDFYNFLKTTIMHEPGHPKFKYHPDLDAQGVPGHIDNTVMDTGPSGVKKSHDDYMILLLREVHGRVRPPDEMDKDPYEYKELRNKSKEDSKKIEKEFNKNGG